MKLSTRSTYGMRALVELALASGHGPVSATLIAARQDLSVAYLEQLLHRLKQQGMVTSMRGPRGGYVLAKDPARITMAEVVQVLDGANGKGRAASRLSRSGRQSRLPGRANGKTRPIRRGGASDAPRHAQHVAQAVTRCVHERITQSLGEVTLRDLCESARAEAGEPLDHRYVFHI